MFHPTCHLLFYGLWVDRQQFRNLRVYPGLVLPVQASQQAQARRLFIIKTFKDRCAARDARRQHELDWIAVCFPKIANTKIVCPTPREKAGEIQSQKQRKIGTSKSPKGRLMRSFSAVIFLLCLLYEPPNRRFFSFFKMLPLWEIILSDTHTPIWDLPLGKVLFWGFWLTPSWGLSWRG